MAKKNESEKNQLVEPEVDYNRAGLWMGEASQSVSLTAFMTAVCFFFMGLLMTSDKVTGVGLRIPLAFLFVSAFGFLYSSLIYTNATGEIARLAHHKFNRQMSVGNILSEYLGVYCLVFALPLAVFALMNDGPLALMVLVSSLAGWLLYHQLGYSILERYLKGHNFHFTIYSIAVIYMVEFFAFYFNNMLFFYGATFLLALTIAGLTIKSLRQGEGE